MMRTETQILPTINSPLVLQMAPSIEMSDAALFSFCQQNRDLHIERTSQGELLIMSPASGSSSYRNLKLARYVDEWAEKDETGFVFDSSAGFILPNGAMRSPDVAWVNRARLTVLTEAEKSRFLPLCPDFVIELRSPTDRLRDLQEKMVEYSANGSQLGWLIDPQTKQVHIYRPTHTPEILNHPLELSGDPILPGLLVTMHTIWQKPF